MKYYVESLTSYNTVNNIFADIDYRLSKLENPTDYQSKYEALRSTIQEQLEALKPWYVGGYVKNAYAAINALKAIDKAVNQ